MKIIGINGSPKKSGSTTEYSLSKVKEAVESEGVDFEIINLSDYKMNGCIDCGVCQKSLNCSQNDDFTNKLIAKLSDTDICGFVFASPVYFGGITSQLKAFFDRSVMFRRNGFLFANKVAAGLTVGRSRNGGQELAVMDIVKSAMVQGMIIVPDASPTSHFGANLWSGHPDSIEKDSSGLETAYNVGKNIASLVKKIN